MTAKAALEEIIRLTHNRRDFTSRRINSIAVGALAQPTGARCNDCGLAYGGDHWIEAVVAHDVWKRIGPSGNEGGILCINCMARRAGELGLREIPLLLTAGPFVASCDTRPQGGDVQQAPFTGGAAPSEAQADAQGTPHE